MTGGESLGGASLRPLASAALGGGAGLDDLAALHHDPAIGEAPDDAEIMGDEHDRHAEAALQVGQQLEDLRLDGHVERRGGLVGDQDFRAVGQRHGDHDALALAAGELVRIGIEPLLRTRNAHERQQLQGARPRRALGHLAVGAQRFADLVPDPVERIERGHRLLEDHAEPAAAEAVQLARGEPQDLLAGHLHGAGGETVGGEQAHNGHHRLALARAALADDGERLAWRHVEADAAHGPQLAVGGAEADVERAQAEDRGFGRHLSGPSGRGRRASRRR